MKRRIFAVLLMVLMLSALSMPIVASAIDIQPYASASIAGGLVNMGGGKHALWVSLTGIYEFKTATSTLYRQTSSGGWERITSVSTSGYEARIEASKIISLTSGYYKVASSGTTQTSSGTIYNYYNI